MRVLLGLCFTLCLLSTTGCDGCAGPGAQEVQLAAQQRAVAQQLAQQHAAEAEHQREQQQLAAAQRAAVEEVLHEDLLTGTIATADHVERMRSIELASCPPDFRVAYMAHIHAWDEAVGVVNANTALENKEGPAAVSGFLSTLFESSATPWQDHLDARQNIQLLATQASKDIKSTFEQVELLAAAYGARLPQSR